MDTTKRPHSIFWPLLLIGLGLFLFFKTLGYISGQTGETLLRLWPLLFIVGGLDSLYRRESFVAPVLMIGIGTIIILNNFNYIQVGSWLVFLRLWPVLLIAWGLDLLVGRQGALAALLGVALGLALIAAITVFAVTQPQVGVPPTTIQVSQDLQNAQQADVNIKSATGVLDISSGAGSGLLASGEVRVPGNTSINHDYTVTNNRGSYSIDSGEIGVIAPFFSTRDYPWNLALTGTVPLDLQSSQAVGEQRLDLTGLDLTNLQTETAVGQNTVILPASGSFSGTVGVAIGDLLIRVPKGTAVELQLNTALASVTLPSDFTRDGNIATSPGAKGASSLIRLKVDVPIGGLRVEYLP